MLLRIELNNNDLVAMAKGSLDVKPEDFSFSDVFDYLYGLHALSPAMSAYIYYQDGLHRYYWKDRGYGRKGWDTSWTIQKG